MMTTMIRCAVLGIKGLSEVEILRRREPLRMCFTIHDYKGGFFNAITYSHVQRIEEGALQTIVYTGQDQGIRWINFNLLCSHQE